MSKLLAPNGKPSNLTPEQYKLVRTPEFKAWFGDWEKAYETGNYSNVSKVIGYNMKGFSGEPLICSHSSYDKFNKFKTPTFFQEGASGGAYGDSNDENYVVYDCFLSVKNPLELRSSELKRDNFLQVISEIYKNANLNNEDYENRMNFAQQYEDGYGLFKLFEKPYWKGEYGYYWEWVFDYCKKNGYDGFVMRDSDQSMQYYITTWVVLNPEQIKLADGTNTTFDGSNPDIRYAGGGEVNSNSFMKWYIEWYKGISDKMFIAISLPTIVTPFKEKNVVILDVFEKKDQSIDAKPYLIKIVQKADEYGVVIYLEPNPRHKYFQDNLEKKNKITKEYLIDYYQIFDFELTPNKQFMKRVPHFDKGGETKNKIMEKQMKINFDNNYAEGGEASFENAGTSMVMYHEKKGDFIVPKGQVYLWLYDVEGSADKLQKEEFDWVFYPYANISMGFQKGFIPPLKRIWTKKFQKDNKGSEHLLGVIKAYLIDKENGQKELYVDMMSVNPTKEKKGIMSYMIKELRDTFNLTQDQVTFSKLTPEGEKFVNKGKYEEGGSIGFIPMDLEEDLMITAKWGGTNIKGVIGFLNAMIDSGLTDSDLLSNPSKNTRFQIERAEEKKIQEIWNIIEPNYKGGLKGNMYYSTIKELVQRANSGDDILNLPMLSIGAHGFVSVCGHLIADRLRNLRNAFNAGENQAALKINQDLTPIYLGVMSKMPGVMAVKAALAAQGYLENVVRLPLVAATSAQVETLRKDLAEGGLNL
jgi:hypothetical protein